MDGSFESYTEKKNGIYDEMRAANEQIGMSKGIVRDPGATPQSGFLIAWRHPEHITGQVEELSLAIGGLYRAIVYGKHNAHTTLSDYGLALNSTIDPGHADYSAILDTLSRAVRNGIDGTIPTDIAERAVSFDDFVSNQKAVIATGQSTRATCQL